MGKWPHGKCEGSFGDGCQFCLLYAVGLETTKIIVFIDNAHKTEIKLLTAQFSFKLMVCYASLKCRLVE